MASQVFGVFPKKKKTEHLIATIEAAMLLGKNIQKLGVEQAYVLTH